MKTIISGLIILLFLTDINSQIISKREEIYNLKQMGNLICSLTAMKGFQNDSLIGINIHLLGRDHAYPSTHDYITLYFGQVSEFNTFLNDIIEFYDQEPGASTVINNNKTYINVEKQIGMKAVYVHDEKVSYTVLTQKQLLRIKNGFYIWTNKNKICLK